MKILIKASLKVFCSWWISFLTENAAEKVCALICHFTKLPANVDLGAEAWFFIYYVLYFSMWYLSTYEIKMPSLSTWICIRLFLFFCSVQKRKAKFSQNYLKQQMEHNVGFGLKAHYFIVPAHQPRFQGQQAGVVVINSLYTTCPTTARRKNLKEIVATRTDTKWEWNNIQIPIWLYKELQYRNSPTPSKKWHTECSLW